MTHHAEPKRENAGTRSNTYCNSIVKYILGRPPLHISRGRHCDRLGWNGCHSASYYNMLPYTILYCTVLYYTILYYTIPYHTILYYTIRPLVRTCCSILCCSRFAMLILYCVRSTLYTWHFSPCISGHRMLYHTIYGHRILILYYIASERGQPGHGH